MIPGGGFAGLNAAKALAKEKRVDVTLIDRRNYHLFQPLLGQMAMAGLSPTEIAAALRSLLSKQQDVRVLCGTVNSISLTERMVQTSFGALP